MKQDLPVRFANEGYYNTIAIDVSKITDIMKFKDEVFGTIDGIRIAIQRDDYEQALQNLETPKNFHILK
jgi:hypothetical protein